MVPPTSAIPNLYYVIFALVEPASSLIGLAAALRDPTSVRNVQALWPTDGPPSVVLVKASVVAAVQLAHVCALFGLVGFVVLTGARKHLASEPALQEKIVEALLSLFLVKDILQILITFGVLGGNWWKVAPWNMAVWSDMAIQSVFMMFRIMWHLGVWRYVDTRDGSIETVRVSSPSKDIPNALA